LARPRVVGDTCGDIGVERGAGAGDGAFGILNTSNVLVEATIGLPGGATVRIDATGAARGWAYPNLHGEIIIEADAAGARVGTRASYDPFGQPIGSVSGQIGTTTADDAVPDTISDAGADYAWVGGHRKLYEHQGSIAAIEMGARVHRLIGTTVADTFGKAASIRHAGHDTRASRRIRHPGSLRKFPPIDHMTSRTGN
jgi:hypothetical protein